MKSKALIHPHPEGERSIKLKIPSLFLWVICILIYRQHAYLVNSGFIRTEEKIHGYELGKVSFTSDTHIMGLS